MTHWLEHIITLLGRIPIVSATYVWIHRLPRAIRAWVLILLVGVSIALAMVGYSICVYVIYSNPLVAEPAQTTTRNTVSLSAVQDVLQQLRAREKALPTEVVDPSR
jgi:hypothetical protein